MLLYCIISSLIIGLWFVYTVYQNDKDEANWVLSLKVHGYVPVLSRDSPKQVKIFVGLSFIPFLNLFFLALLLFDLYDKE